VTIAGITAYARRAAHAASDAINASEAPQAPGRIATKINRGIATARLCDVRM